MNQEEALIHFLDELINDKFPDSTFLPEEKKEMVDELLPKLNQTLFLKYMTRLSPEEIRELDKLMASTVENNTIAEYFSEKIPDQTSLLTEALMEFREVYLGPPRV